METTVKDIRQAYAEHLQGLHWSWFYTQTFRQPRTDVLRAQRAVWKELAHLGVGRAFLAVEPHVMGDVHIHGLLDDGHQNVLDLGDVGFHSWEGACSTLLKRFGRVRLERINNSSKVSLYCAKYVLKGSTRGDHYGYYGDAYNWTRPESLAVNHPQYTVKRGEPKVSTSVKALDKLQKVVYDIDNILDKEPARKYDRRTSGIIGSQRVWLKP